MNQVFIYHGPVDAFEKELPDEFYTLTSLVHDYEEARKANRNITNNYYDHLVAYSDAYSGITQSAVQSFSSLLSLFEIENLYLQNPPKAVYQQIKDYNTDNVHEKNFRYKTIGLKTLKAFHDGFDNNVIGQDKVMKRLLMHLYPLVGTKRKKPLVLMFYGPSGVGKTETAKYIAKLLGQKLFRKQLSMFHNEEFLNYLFGSKHSHNSFAKELLERQSNVILLDEFDKTPSVFHSAFYQLFDEGIFEDQNYAVHLNKGIIICTSNFPNLDEIQKALGDPIFFRFDGFVEFGTLSQESMIRIIDKELARQYKDISSKDRDAISIEMIREQLVQRISSFDNARGISHAISDMLSYYAVRHALDIE
ncbi:AAA family ATPase [Ruminococcaceae bacterium OttesenSCG-928-A11]|nr:AAA family ATPase [Ruminococcaceae bacterium OttesenSCG-928-A11]